MKINEIGEFGLIDILQKELPKNSSSVIKGIGDDAAVVKVDGDKLQLISTDIMVEGEHFLFEFSTPWQVGAKALNSNISDIAAMGGRPTCATVALGIPGNYDVELIQGIYRGIGEMAAKYQVDIVGGDTVASPVIFLNITIMGEVPKDQAIYRSGANSGDIIFVTGPLGGSAAGLYHLQHPIESCPEDLANKVTAMYHVGFPRLEESKILAASGQVSAMNDISDGLASEMYEICSASGVGCQIYQNRIPFYEATKALAVRTGQSALDWALYGGEDYQLVFTVSPENAFRLAEHMKSAGKPVTRIGEIIDTGMYIINEKQNKKPLTKGGFNHFSQ